MSPFAVRFQRVLQAPPERIYQAFTRAEAWAKWLPPHGFVATVQALDAQVGGHWRMSFTQLATGQTHSFGGQYLELVPGQRLVYDSRFDDPGLPGTLLTTVVLTPVFCGTELQIVQEGIPPVVPEAACLLGWQQSLQLLALLVEAPA